MAQKIRLNIEALLDPLRVIRMEYLHDTRYIHAGHALSLHYADIFNPLSAHLSSRAFELAATISSTSSIVAPKRLTLGTAGATGTSTQPRLSIRPAPTTSLKWSWRNKLVSALLN